MNEQSIEQLKKIEGELNKIIEKHFAFVVDGEQYEFIDNGANNEVIGLHLESEVDLREFRKDLSNYIAKTTPSHDEIKREAVREIIDRVEMWSDDGRIKSTEDITRLIEQTYLKETI